MIIRSIWPATRSCMAGPPPRYGTNAKRVPVSFWNRMPATCDPAVGIACDALSGFAFNQVTSNGIRRSARGERHDHGDWARGIDLLMRGCEAHESRERDRKKQSHA